LFFSLEQPAVAVGIGERGEGKAGAPFRVTPGCAAKHSARDAGVHQTLVSMPNRYEGVEDTFV